MGILNKEEELMFDLNASLVDAESAFDEVQNWITDIMSSEPHIEEPDVLMLLSSWGKASSILYYLKKLDDGELEKIFDANPEDNYEEYKQRQATLEGLIKGVDKTDTELFESAINRQLTTRASEWRERLKLFNSPEDLDNPVDNFLDDLMEGRDFLEYALIGVHLVKAQQPHFMSVDIYGFTNHIYETDKVFKKLLGKRREIIYWADPTFWWRHKSE